MLGMGRVSVPGGQDLMHDIPTSVREDVSMEESADLLSRTPFFKHVDHAFLRQLSAATSTFLFAPGDIVLYAGDMGREMYLIAKGYVEVCQFVMYAWACMYIHVCEILSLHAVCTLTSCSVHVLCVSS